MNDAPTFAGGRTSSPLQLANRKQVGATQAALIAAFEALPAPTAPRAGIPYKMMIPVLARELTLMARTDPEVTLTRSAREKLVKVTHAAAALASMIDELSAEPPCTSTSFERHAASALAWSLLDRERRFQALNLSTQLSDFVGAVKLTSARTRRGRPGKISAIEIARFLGTEFEKLTGKAPARSTYEDRSSGHFVGLVTAVFAALGVRANPDQCARKAIDERKSPSA